MSNVAIVIPTKNAGLMFREVLDGVFTQNGDYDVLVIDSGSTDETLDVVADSPARLLEISPEEFDHGGTRNLGVRETDGEFVVFLTQDATPLDGWLRELLAPLRTDDEIAGAYSRQIPRESATPMKRHFLSEFYPPESDVRSLDPSEQPTREDVFFSNVSSAIRRSVWQDHRFPTDRIMSEDQAWARNVLEDGWKIQYAAASLVRHSHREGIRDIFKRYFDSGASLEMSELVADENSPLREMIGYQMREIEFLLRNGAAHWLPYALLYSVAKFSGLQLGRRHEWLPTWAVRRLSDTLSTKYYSGKSGEIE